MSHFIGIIIGGLEVIAGVALAVISGGTLLAVAIPLIAAGVGTLLTGIGTLLSQHNQQPGFSTATTNPISAQLIPYGRNVVGGTFIFINEWGDQDKWLDLVIVISAVPIQSFDALLLDKQPIQLSTSGGTFNAVGDSFSPVQQTINIASISRSNGVVTVQTAPSGGDIPLLVEGDNIVIQGITASSGQTLNGTYRISNPVHNPTTPSYMTFQYLCGGLNTTLGSGGQVKTAWPDYGKKIHCEVLLGNQTATFPGMLSGTPTDGDTGNIAMPSVNPWTAEHICKGKACVFLRLHFDPMVWSGGLPKISFLIHGKNNIFDPRLGAFGAAGTTGYSENAALCIADYLSNTTFGMKAVYGTEIPLPALIAAANTCDETEPLASGATEPRYALNGKFDTSISRGEVLQNMLTACAGKLSYQAGQYLIQPGAWYGATPVTAPGIGQMSGKYEWKVTTSLRDRFNGVRGTYIAPYNNWQSSDIPPYAQDSLHGYSMSPPWSSTLTYGPNTAVSYGGVDYVSISTNTNQVPTNTTYWTTQYTDVNLAADGGDRRWLDIQLPFTISSATAQRIMKIELLRRRLSGTGTFRYNLAGYVMTALDVVSMNLDNFGWTGKLLEVLQHRFVLDRQNQGGAEVVVLGTEIDVQETDASIYDWSTTEELSPAGYQQSTLPNPFSPAAPTNLALESDESTTVVTPQGLQDTIVVTWTAPADGYVSGNGHIEVQYQPTLDYSPGFVLIRPGSLSSVQGFETNWIPEMVNGDITINGLTQQIASVVSATMLMLTAPFAGTASSSKASSGAPVLAVVAVIPSALSGGSYTQLDIYCNIGADAAPVGASITVAGLAGPGAIFNGTYTVAANGGYGSPIIVNATFSSATLAYVGAGTLTIAGTLAASTSGAIASPYLITYGDTWTGLPSVGPEVTRMVINGVVDGDEYLVRIRSVNAGGFPSNWVTAGPVRAEGQNAPLPFRPYAELYFFSPSGFGFALAQILGSSGVQSIAIKGSQPVNSLSSVDPPVVDTTAITSGLTSGTLETGDGTYQVFGIDASGMRTAGSNYGSYSATSYKSEITFGTTFAAGTVGYEVFIGSDIEHLIGLGAVTGTPTSITISTSAISGYGPPDPRAVKYVARGKRVIHAGIAAVNAISTTPGATLGADDTITVGVPSALSANEWAGRDLIVVGKAGTPATQAFSIIPILGNDTNVPANLSVLSASASVVGAGDLLLVGTRSTSSGINHIEDTGLVSPFAPSGLTANAEIGNLLRVLYDPTGAAVQGDLVKITGNTSTGFTTTPFQIAPGNGTVFIEEEPTWRTGSIVSDISPNSVAPTLMTSGFTPLTSIPASSLEGYVALVELLVQDKYGNNSPEIPESYRMIYVVPGPSSSNPAGYVIAPIASGVATIDLSGGDNQEVQLTTATTMLANPINAPSGTSFNIVLVQDATGGRRVTFGSAYVGLDPTSFDTTATLATVLPLVVKSATSVFLSGPPKSFQMAP